MFFEYAEKLYLGKGALIINHKSEYQFNGTIWDTFERLLYTANAEKKIISCEQLE